MQEPEVALANEEYIFYASANKAVQENEECSLYGNKAVYPDPAPKSEVFANLPQNILELENNLWSSVKSGNLSVNSKKTERKIYIESGVVAGVVVIAVATYFVRKRKKDKEQDLGDLYEQN